MDFVDLFRPNCKHSDWEKRAKTAKKLKNQKIIADIAKKDEYYSVREAAVQKITDQNLLVDVV